MRVCVPMEVIVLGLLARQVLSVSVACCGNAANSFLDSGIKLIVRGRPFCQHHMSLMQRQICGSIKKQVSGFLHFQSP